MKCMMFDNFTHEMCKFCSAWCENRLHDETVTINKLPDNYEHPRNIRLS